MGLFIYVDLINHKLKIIVRCFVYNEISYEKKPLKNQPKFILMMYSMRFRINVGAAPLIIKPIDHKTCVILRNQKLF